MNEENEWDIERLAWYFKLLISVGGVFLYTKLLEMSQYIIYVRHEYLER